MQIGDIVRFRANARAKAAQTCHQYQITAAIIRDPDEFGRFQVDAGFGYSIYACAEELDTVITKSYIPIPREFE